LNSTYYFVLVLYNVLVEVTVLHGFVLVAYRVLVTVVVETPVGYNSVVQKADPVGSLLSTVYAKDALHAACPACAKTNAQRKTSNGCMMRCCLAAALKRRT
jgi:hypothetical protein